MPCGRRRRARRGKALDRRPRSIGAEKLLHSRSGIMPALSIVIRRVSRSRAAAVLLAAAHAIGPVRAQEWPARALTMVVPFAPGGGTDVLGRIVGRRLSEVLGQ